MLSIPARRRAHPGRIAVPCDKTTGWPRFATPSSGLRTPSYLLPIEMKTERGVREGKTLDIGFDAKQAFLFDRRSGERIR